MKKTLICFLLLIGLPLISMLVASLLPKRYTATMGLLVDQTIARAAQADSLYATLEDLSNFNRARSVQTTMEVLTGTDVLLLALRRVQDRYPRLLPSDQAPFEAYENLLTRLRVDAQRESDFVRVSVTQPDPELAAALANEIGLAYLEHSRNVAGQTEAAAVALVETQIQSTESRLTKLDQEIATLQAQTRIPDYASSVQSGVKLDGDVKLRLQETIAEAKGLEQQIALARRELAQTPKVISGNTATEYNRQLDTLDNQIIDARSAWEGLNERYMPDHPDVMAAKGRLDSLVRDRRTLVTKREAYTTQTPNPIYQNLQQELNNLLVRNESAQARLVNYTQMSSEYDKLVEGLPAKQARISALQRQRAVYETGYQQLLQRKTILEASGVRRSNAAIVSNAIPPSQASFPNIPAFGLIGFAFALLLVFLVVTARVPLPGERAAGLTPSNVPPLDPAQDPALQSREDKTLEKTE